MNQLIGMYGYVAPILAVVAILAAVAPKVPNWMWGIMTVAAGLVLAIAGGYISLAAIAAGGDSRVGLAAVGGCALGLAWAATWSLYFWEHRK